MRVIKLDASLWKSPLDFYEAILIGLEAPHWHGENVNALIDSMVHGGINGIEPPYKIWVVGTDGLPESVKQELDWMVQDINKVQGTEKNIAFQIDP